MLYTKQKTKKNVLQNTIFLQNILMCIKNTINNLYDLEQLFLKHILLHLTKFLYQIIM